VFEDDDDRHYTVVINDEEQYSIWPTGRDVPEGWREVGVIGPKATCLEHIKEVWVDMRPKSLRQRMGV
jgi:MbtH protein